MQSDNNEYGYLRSTVDGVWLLIPGDEVGEHDELVAAIRDADYSTANWHALTKKYRELYLNRYSIEDIGELRVLLE
jgi:hypothetical protein